jgi:arachidonate 15-lipoxygenase (second type)/8-lipoxygenase (S-type)
MDQWLRLGRLTIVVNFQGFAFQQAAAALLFNTGGNIDLAFVFSGADARTTTQQYYTETAGNFQSNYFQKQFVARGLINATYGPELVDNPFVEDASVIHTALTDFMTTFVDSYYASESAINNDKELQCWTTEAKTAKLMDFPTSISRQTLIDMLTHVAFLVSVQHHTLNTNDPVTMNGLLPFHPAALYSPIPTSKGVTNILPFLPPATQAILQINILAGFARPEFVNTDKSLVNMFNDPTLLAGLNSKTKTAAATFLSSMQSFSDVVSARTFDSEGLSQGMPFVWRVLDPQVAPFYAAI